MFLTYWTLSVLGSMTPIRLGSNISGSRDVIGHVTVRFPSPQTVLR